MTLTLETLTQLASYAGDDPAGFYPKSISNATMRELLAGYERGREPGTPKPGTDADGWIPHNGGPRPVPGETLVKVWFADGYQSDPYRADQWPSAFWTPTDHIIAYRPEGQGGKPT